MMPDPEADRGEHAFRYALLPHAGDWRAAHVPREADEVADPLLVLPLAEAVGAGAPRAPFRLELEAGDVEIACCKPAEDLAGRVVRLVERHGGLARGRIHWAGPVGEVRPVDLLEEPAEAEVEHDAAARITTFTLDAFEILTLRTDA
jgi:alpha-mannosidase